MRFARVFIDPDLYYTQKSTPTLFPLMYAFLDQLPLFLGPVSYTHLDVYKRQPLSADNRSETVDFPTRSAPSTTTIILVPS